MFHLKPFVINTNLLIVLVFSALIIPFSTVHADDSTRIEECNTSELSYWRMDDPIHVKDGYCFAEDRTEISFTDDFTDFKLSFDTRLSPSSNIVIEIVNSSGYSLMLSISPTEIRLYKFWLTRSGDGSSTSDFFRAGTTLNTHDFYHFDLKHDNGKTQVFLNDELIDQTGMMDSIDAYMIRMFFTGGVEFDNLAFENIIVSPNGLPPLVLEPELRETFIVFRKNDDTLWKVHPDGSGLEQIITYGYLYNFSPDGKYLAIHSNNWKLIDIETNTILPGWDLGLSTSQLFWINTGQLLSIVDDQEIHIHDAGSTIPVRKIRLPKPTDDSNFLTTRITDIHPSPTMPYILGLFWNEGEDRRLGIMNLDTEEIRLLPGLSTGMYNIGNWSIDGTKLHFPKITVDFPSIDWKEKTTDLKTPIYSQDGSGGLYAYEGSLAPDGEHFVYSNNGRITVLNIDLIPDDDYYDPLANTGRLTPGSNSDYEIVDGYDPIWQPNPSLKITTELNEVTELSPTETWGAIFVTNTPKMRIIETEEPNKMDRLTGSSNRESESSSQLLKRNFDFRFMLNLFLLVFGIFLFLVAGILTFRAIGQLTCKICGKKNRMFDVYCGNCGTNLNNANFYPAFNNIRLLLAILVAGFVIISLGTFFIAKSKYRNQITLMNQQNNVSVANEDLSSNGSSKDSQKNENSNNGINLAVSGNVCQNLNFQKDSIYEVYRKFFAQDFEKLYNDDEHDEHSCDLGGLSFSPSKKFLLLYNGRLKQETGWMTIYSTETGKPLLAWQHSKWSQKIIWSPEENRIASRESNGWRIFEFSNEFASQKGNNFIEDSLRNDEWGTLSDPEKIVWTNNDVIVRKISNGIQFINVITGEISETAITDMKMVGGMQSKNSEPTAYFDLSNNGEYFVTVIPKDKIAQLWESRTGKLVWEATIEQFGVGGASVDWSPSDRYIIVDHVRGVLIIEASSGHIVYDRGGGNFKGNPWSTDEKRIFIEVEYYQSEDVLISKDALIVADISTGEESLISLTNKNEIRWFENSTWLPDGRIVVEVVQSDSSYPHFWIVNPIENRWVELSEASFDR